MKDFIKNHKRRLIQVICAVLYNCNFTGFLKGSIYQGKLKGVCVPGLNCYSCPGAIGACPLGSLQSALVSSKYKFPYYILGMLLLIGILFGRVVCGFLCPFGLLQDLLYKIPLPKLKKSKFTRALSYLKYVILIVMVVGIPIVLKIPGFCKYICPQGTLEGGIILTAMNEPLRKLTGALFIWKLSLMILMLLTMISVFRCFCRFICPLGAIYSFFNRISITGVKVDEDRCVNCNICIEECKMDVMKVSDHECIHCGECIKKCPVSAISYRSLKNRGDRGDRP